MNELIIRYLNEENSLAEDQQVIDWVKASEENAKEFARISSLHGQLRMELQGCGKEVVGCEPVETKDCRMIRFPLQRIGKLVALAASVVILFAVVLSKRRDAPVAHLVQTKGVEWVGDAITLDSYLEPQSLQFKSGLMRLLFDSGVEVTIKGPARYEIVSGNRAILNSGVLVAYVPPSAEGFTVDTPNLEVVDLGTSFGVLASPGGVDVSVFKGEVELNSVASNIREKLTEGRSASMRNGNLEVMDIDVNPFESLWYVASGIANSSDNFKFALPWTRAMRACRDDDHIYIFAERHASPLESDLKLNATQPGIYPESTDVAKDIVKAGTIVRSYLIQFNPGPPNPDNRGFRDIVGEISFADPIVGLIFRAEDLGASDYLTSSRTPFRPEGRGLEPSGGNYSDMIEFSQDRRTLSLRFHERVTSWDQVRVIVAPRRSF